MTLARVARCALVAVVAVPAAGAAQVNDRPLDHVSIAPPRLPRLDLGTVSVMAPPPRRLGAFTLEAPVMGGEIVRVRVPVGELVSKAAHGVLAANQRRREAAARRDVQQALNAFIAQTARVPD